MKGCLGLSKETVVSLDKENHCIKDSIEVDNIKSTEMQIEINIRLLHTMLENTREEATSPSKKSQSCCYKGLEPWVGFAITLPYLLTLSSLLQGDHVSISDRSRLGYHSIFFLSSYKTLKTGRCLARLLLNFLMGIWQFDLLACMVRSSFCGLIQAVYGPVPTRYVAGIAGFSAAAL